MITLAFVKSTSDYAAIKDRIERKVAAYFDSHKEMLTMMENTGMVTGHPLRLAMYEEMNPVLEIRFLKDRLGDELVRSVYDNPQFTIKMFSTDGYEQFMDDDIRRRAMYAVLASIHSQEKKLMTKMLTDEVYWLYRQAIYNKAIELRYHRLGV